MRKLTIGMLAVSTETGRVGKLDIDEHGHHYLVDDVERTRILSEYVRAYDGHNDRIRLSPDETGERAPTSSGPNVPAAMASRFKPFIVECEANALITERWRIMARNAKHAQELFESGETGEFVEDATVGEEENRTFVSATLEFDGTAPIAYVDARADHNRAVVDETLAEVWSGVATTYAALHEGLANMIDSGRLIEADIPDDFAWFVDSLNYLRHHPRLTSEG